MPTHYNKIAGQSVERLAALSDGIFAVAMTLLDLDLRVSADAIHSEQDPWHALQDRLHRRSPAQLRHRPPASSCEPSKP